ncbi:uncharacterized protein LOC116416601 [Nasonia vitripennis]|uniref:Gag-like protein n=1 Tax=Nasonia vitripennis TaxID=7425 RepID=A0A7M7Q862_NASVI|nr:uncharacterized protein LOC116416601 [Nasonia vitripennis]
MAGEKGPPDKGSKSFLKCHDQNEVSTVICIICDSAFHQSCARQKKLKFISERLIICQDHPNLTSKVDENVLSESARSLIATVKLKQSEEIRKEVRKEILEDLSNKSVELNSTFRDFEAECDHVHKENELLRQLNKELDEKNAMLRDLLSQSTTKQVNIQESIKTYAEITGSSKQLPKRIPKIIIKPEGETSKSVIKNNITKCLFNEKSIQTNDVYCLKNSNQIMVKCLDEASVIKTESLLKANFEDICEVKLEQLNNPKIKIVGIANVSNMDMKGIEDDINTRNFANFETKARLLYMYSNSKTNLTSVLVEVTPDIYRSIRDRNNKIFVGWQSCRVYDLINIKPCMKCARFGHNTAKCMNETTCLRCSQAHKTTSCKNPALACPNCYYINRKYATDLNINHDAMDSNQCHIFKNKIKKYIDSTDYPVKPRLPTVKPMPIYYQEEAIENVYEESDGMSDTDRSIRASWVTVKQEVPRRADRFGDARSLRFGPANQRARLGQSPRPR